jgi:chromosome segregation ATPase
VAEGELDFQSLYDQAGIPNTDEVEALERFLHGLDESLPQSSKLAAAKAFLGAIGKAPADVLRDAGRKIQVVRMVADAKRTDVEKAASEHQAAIATLQRQIDEQRAAVETLKRDLEAVRSKCAAEEGRLQGARVFFGAVGDAVAGSGPGKG